MPIRYGQLHQGAILKDHEVKAIRELYEEREWRPRKGKKPSWRRRWTIDELANLYGVAPCTVQRILAGKAWTHVPCPPKRSQPK